MRNWKATERFAALCLTSIGNHNDMVFFVNLSLLAHFLAGEETALGLDIF